MSFQIPRTESRHLHPLAMSRNELWQLLEGSSVDELPPNVFKHQLERSMKRLTTEKGPIELPWHSLMDKPAILALVLPLLPSTALSSLLYTILRVNKVSPCVLDWLYTHKTWPLTDATGIPTLPVLQRAYALLLKRSTTSNEWLLLLSRTEDVQVDPPTYSRKRKRCLRMEQLHGDDCTQDSTWKGLSTLHITSSDHHVLQHLQKQISLRALAQTCSWETSLLHSPAVRFVLWTTQSAPSYQNSPLWTSIHVEAILELCRFDLLDPVLDQIQVQLETGSVDVWLRQALGFLSILPESRIRSLLMQLSTLYEHPSLFVVRKSLKKATLQQVQAQLQATGVFGYTCTKPSKIKCSQTARDWVYDPHAKKSMRAVSHLNPGLFVRPNFHQPCSAGKTDQKLVRIIDSIPPLPSDVVRHIMSYQGYKRLVRMSLVCRDWHVLSQDDELWKSLFAHRFGKGVDTDDYRMLFIEKWHLERKVRFRRAKNGWRARVCPYHNCSHVSTTLGMQKRHEKMHKKRRGTKRDVSS